VVNFGNQEILGCRKEGRMKFWLLENGIEINSNDLYKKPVNIECHQCHKSKRVKFYGGNNGLIKRQYICQSCSKQGDRNAFFGKKHSDETKKSISESNTGNLVGDKNPMWGKSVWDTYSPKQFESIRKKISKKSQGSGNAFWGRTHTDEFKKKKAKQARQWIIDHPEHLRKMVAHSLEAQKRFRKTGIEAVTEVELQRRKIPHKYNKILHRKYQYDFLIGDKFLLEVHGDYWHANPEIYGPGKRSLNDRQIFKVEQDKSKKVFAEKYGYKIFYIWETEINNLDFTVISQIERILNGVI